MSLTRILHFFVFFENDQLHSEKGLQRYRTFINIRNGIFCYRRFYSLILGGFFMVQTSNPLCIPPNVVYNPAHGFAAYLPFEVWIDALEGVMKFQ